MEAVSDYDDVVLEKYLNEKEPTEQELYLAIRNATLSVNFIPVLCGSSFRNKGVQGLLDAVIDYLPSPLDVPPVSGTNLISSDEEIRENRPDAPLAGVAFKIMTDPHVGKLTFFRIYSGTLSSGSYVINSRTNNRERVSRILLMHANKREQLQEAFAGDIVAVIGVKDVMTGDTLCDPEWPISLEAMEFPEPGRYTWEVIFDGTEIIGTADVEAILIPAHGEETDEEPHEEMNEEPREEMN